MIRLDDPMLWGNEAAEDEDPEVLASYFVTQDNFARVFDPGVKLSIVRAKKGMGKSALLRECEYRVRHDTNKSFVVSMKGFELVAQRPIKRDLTAHEHIDDWMQRICMCINRGLGGEVNFAFTDDKMLLVETAELSGFKDRNFVGSLVDRLKGKLGQVELKHLEIRDHHQLLKRIMSDGDWQIWLFVDDIDATFVDTTEERMRISTFFSACRHLTASFRGINIRTCVRSDVWASLSSSNEALDKINQYLFDVHWSNKQIAKMLCERIISYQRREPGPHQEQQVNPSGSETNYRNQFGALSLVFAERFPWGHKSVPPYRVIHTYAGGRPRWALQLCRMAGHEATKKKDILIKIGHIRLCLGAYGRERLDDITREHLHQCPKISEITNAFSRKRTTYTTEQLIEFIDDGVLEENISIDSKPVNSAVEVMRFLFRAGFIVANDNKDKTIYYQFEEKPELLKSSTNLDDGMTWDIHPSFHTALGFSKAR